MTQQQRDWFTVTEIGPTTWSIEERLGVDVCRSYVVAGTRDAAVLDTGMGVADFAGLVASLTDRDPLVLHSHAHWDHIGASHRYQRVLVHPSEADDLRAGTPHEHFVAALAAEAMTADQLPDSFDPATASIPGVEPSGLLNGGDVFDLGGRTLEAFHTPGHSPGGVTLLDRANRLLFPGDAVNLGNLFLHFEGGDPAAWRASIALLADLAQHADAIYPTHDAAPITAADVREIHTAFEEIWSGDRQPSTQRSDYGGLADVFECGRFRFWLRPGTYGAGVG
jgi:glyoxylase-like metal-dependent hydrolase (beta-lactamase superfamily II)